jgi:hypothetical protein
MDGARRALVIAVVGLGLSSAACGAHGGPTAPRAPSSSPALTSAAAPIAAAAEETKTVTIDYAFDRDVVTKDFDKTFSDGFEKKGLKVDESLTAHARFDVKDAKLTGTVTYVKNAMGQYSILEADLVTSGHYDADVQIEMDVSMKGDSSIAKESDWEKTLIGGKPVPLVKNMMPASIPIAGSLFLEAHFDLSAACDVQVDGPVRATTGVGIAGDVRMSAKYKKDGFPGADGKSGNFQVEAKSPSFELAPKPYLKVEGKAHSVKGRCHLQPTAVVLLDDSLGVKLAVEPYVDLEAKRAGAREKWSFDAQAGVSVNAGTDVESFGRPMRKAKEYALFDLSLTKPGDEMGAPPRNVASTAAPKTGRAAKVQAASVLDAGIGGAAPGADKAAMTRTMRGASGKKKKL